jgi:DNA replication protein DnaC
MISHMPFMTEVRKERMISIFAENRALAEEDRMRQMEVRQAKERKEDLEGYRERLKQQCGLSGEMWADTFAAYKPKHPTQHQAKTAAVRWVANFPDVTRGLCFFGPAGVGKSHLLRALTQALYSDKKSVWIAKYLYLPDFFERLRDESRMDEESRPLSTKRMVFEADVILLDDVSKLDTSVHPGWFPNVMGTLIDQAERTGQPRICATSNDKPEAFESRFDVPFSSRLKALMDWIPVGGPNARLDPR